MAIPPILPLVFALYVLQGLVVGVHALRRWTGMLPLGCALGAIVYIMMITDPWVPRLAADFAVFSGFPVGSLTFFPVTVMGILLVRVSDGSRPMWILVASLMGVYVLIYLTTLFLRLWIHWVDEGLMTLHLELRPEMLVGVLSLLRSATALLIDVLVMVGLYNLLGYGLPSWPKGIIFGLVLAAGLITDAVVYPLLVLDPQRILADLPGQVIGKGIVAVVITLPMIPHVSRCAECGPQDPAAAEG